MTRSHALPLSSLHCSACFILRCPLPLSLIPFLHPAHATHLVSHFSRFRRSVPSPSFLSLVFLFFILSCLPAHVTSVGHVSPPLSMCLSLSLLSLALLVVLLSLPRLLSSLPDPSPPPLLVPLLSSSSSSHLPPCLILPPPRLRTACSPTFPRCVFPRRLAR